MKKVIEFYSDQKMSPSAKEILALAKAEVFGEESVGFKRVDAPAPGVLSFGNHKHGSVRALSFAQIPTAPNALTSLCQSLTLMRDGVPEYTMDYRVVENETQFQDTTVWMEEHGFDHYVCLDIENAKDGTLLSLAVTYGQEVVVFPDWVMQDEFMLQRLVTVLYGHYYIIGANWKYDAVKLYDATGIMLPVFFDTMLAHHSLHPSAKGFHGLKSMAEMILGVPDWDAPMKKHTGSGKNTDYGKAPREMLYLYNAYDVFYTFKLFLHLFPEACNHEAFWTEIYWANGFNFIEANRIKIDVDYVKGMQDQLLEQEKDALEALPEGFNPNSPQQIKKMLAEAGLSVPNTQAGTLTEHKDHPLVAALLTYRKFNKRRTTYIEPYLRTEVGGFIKTTVNIHGTQSGRMSGSSPNVQNIPRDKSIRKCFIARKPGWVRIECDYAQAELRAQAVMSEDPDMIAAFQPDSPDFFDGLMPVAFPDTFTTLGDYLRYEDHECGGDEKDYRAKVKGVIYGLNFGRGARAIADALEMPAEDAQGIIDSFMGAYPAYAGWRRRIEIAAVDPAQRGFLTGPYGLRYDVEVVTDSNFSSLQRSGLSFLPQNSVSFLCTTAAVRVCYRLMREYPGRALVNMVVHDAIYVDCPEEIAEEVALIVKQEMERIGVETYGTVVLFTAEPAWFERWGDKETKMGKQIPDEWAYPEEWDEDLNDDEKEDD